MELTKENMQNLRQDYRSAQLSENEVDIDPIQQFKKWFSEAISAQLFEPNVMTLATSDRDGNPSARIVLLKDCNEKGFVFYTNYESRKGRELADNPAAALLFFWPELERQVRIEGFVKRVDAETSTAYFHSRPIDSQIGAVASPQSEVIASREELEQKVAALSSEYEGKEIPRPEHWGGYIVEPDIIEFWQGRPNRLHDRILYEWTGDSWTTDRLAP